jgi:hypothetical protein
VPIDIGVGVSPAVPDLDVESGATFLPCARRADPLHCGGGCVLLDSAPISGCSPTGGASATEGSRPSDHWLEILFKSKLYVWDGCEHWVDRFPGASLYSSNDCESIWVTDDPTDQWGPTDGHGESIGW